MDVPAQDRVDRVDVPAHHRVDVPAQDHVDPVDVPAQDRVDRVDVSAQDPVYVPAHDRVDVAVQTSLFKADAAVQTDGDVDMAEFIERVRRCELRPSSVVGCGMVFLNQEQEATYANHRRKLLAPLSFLETIDEDAVLEFVYEEAEEESGFYRVRVVPNRCSQ